MRKSIHKIGDIIDNRPDGSVIYMSHKGVLNLDPPALVLVNNRWVREDPLEEAKLEDESFLAPSK
jgi:hypothetical protein